jgi:hypothetical protein
VGHTASAPTVSFLVDASVPTVELTCPAAPVVLGSSASASWTASDTGSGLAGATSGTVALDASAVGTRTASAPVALDNVGHTSAVATCQYSVVYDFAGFFQPIDNGGVLNRVKAGSAIPVKFSLAGNQGLGILAGAPTATPITCTAGAQVDLLEAVSTTTTSGLKYAATADQDNYTWKTTSSYAGTCQRLTVRLVDGTVHTALFTFTK